MPIKTIAVEARFESSKMAKVGVEHSVSNPGAVRVTLLVFMAPRP